MAFAGMGEMFQMIGESVQNNKNITFQQMQNVQNRKHFKRDRAAQWGREDQLRQEMYGREDSRFQRLISDAEAAGVHPLFAMGAAGGGGASMSSSPMIYAGGQAPQSRVDMSSVGRMFEARERKETHVQALAESRARQKLLEAQTMDVVQKMEEDSNAARVRQRANVNQDIVKVPAQSKDYTLPGVAPPARVFRKPGEPWRTSQSATAQQMEDEYGEITDWTYGPYRAVSDWFWYNEGWKYFVPNSVTHRLYQEEQSR